MLPSEILVEHLDWLSRLRGIAVVATLSAFAVGASTGLLPDARHGLAAACVFVVHYFYARHRARRRREGPAGMGQAKALEREVFTQLIVDLLLVTVLLHGSGGVQNPFAVVYAFHMAIGAMLLPGRPALLVAFFGIAAYGTMAAGELFAVFPAHSVLVANWVATPGRDPLFVVWRFTAIAMMMLGTLYFVHVLASRYRQAEALRREHDRVALSRERFVRIGEVAAGVAHSVRNPLHGLLNGVELLGGRVRDDAQAAETLSLMGEALQRIDRVTQRLLVLSRDAPLACSSSDVDAMVGEALRLSSPRTRGSLAQLVVEPGGAGAAMIDSVRLGEAVVNVVDNALDACREGGTVTVRTSAAPEGDVIIDVEDSGPGIQAADLEKVFDPFFTTKAIGEGSGLGLAITRRVVEEHGGRVTVDSAPGRGTRVRLQLPRSAGLEETA